ncbi:MAG: methylated-DNA--[Clostridia bacterium]|nr:methylated-DNA--[protein]-cysteine S-methyltransferase [Clostridia bacterium]
MYYQTTYESPVGLMTLGSDGENLVGLWTQGQKYFADTAPQQMALCHKLPVFDAAKAWLDGYFAGERPQISQLPLAPIGGEFRQRVWKLLTQIPYGQVTTYGQLAREIAAMTGKKTMSAQAVGGAVGHNPISIIIPCHRVVGTNGSLTGFSGGLEMKIKLLQHEGVDMAGLFIPRKGTAL